RCTRFESFAEKPRRSKLRQKSLETLVFWVWTCSRLDSLILTSHGLTMEHPMTTDLMTDEQKSIYKDYRAAKRHLKQGRDFADWMKIARGYDQARREAMRQAGTNQPQGPNYREEFTKIDRREKLIDRDPKTGKEFPSKEDRTYCIKVIENYAVPSYDPR